jgi:hypothetical protein
LFRDVTDAAAEPAPLIVVKPIIKKIASFLTDPRGLGETGEVLLGVADGKTIRLILPPRVRSPMAEVASSELPSLSAALAGQFGFMRTIDYRGQDVLVAYRPVDSRYPGWGLIAKFDWAEADAPVRLLRGLLASVGGAIVLLGLGTVYAIARLLARTTRQPFQPPEMKKLKVKRR